MIIRSALVVVTLVLCARTADAQTWPERVWADLNGGVQTAGRKVSDSFEIEQFTETGTVDVGYPATSSAIIDGGVGVRVWKRFGVGVSVTQASSRTAASVSAEIPHPFFDNRPRSIEGTADAERSEVAAHVQFAYLVNLSPRVRLIVSAGPSFFSVEQTFVSDVKFSQEYPYDTATFTGATTQRSHASKVGVNAGADLVWMFSSQIGAGGLVRFTRASVTEDAGNGRSLSLDAGGVQVAAGVRFLF